MSQRVFAHIDVAALQHNLQAVKALAPDSCVLAMIKANGYGHGLLRVAGALAAADAFGVASIDEAMNLRQAGVAKPIVVMSGFIDRDELMQMVEHNLTAVLHQIEQVNLLQQHALATPLSVWLKVDTGMFRLGFSPEQLNSVYQRLATNPNVKQPLGFMTHLACSDELANGHTSAQIALFEKSILWPGARSLACSAAIIAWPQTHADWVRPGIMLYGASPFSHCHAAELGLKPVMSLSSRLVAIKPLRKGDKVGYGATWECPHDTHLGIASIGYGDGYPRQAPNGTPVLVNGQRCALVGRVSMDLISIDLEHQPNAKVGDPVLLWGKQLPVEEIAAAAGTSCYELLCKVTARVPFNTD